MKSLVSFFRLNGPQRVMAVEAAAGLLLARVVVRCAPMRYWRRQVTRAADASHDELVLGRQAGRTVRAVARRLPFKAVCLPRAMAAHWILRRRGVSSQLVFGARRAAPGRSPDYHAWLTVDGKCVIGGRDAGIFAPFPTLGPRPESGTATTGSRAGGGRPA